MKQNAALEVVHAWHEALNEADAARLLALSDPNVEIVGPRGSAHGLDMLERLVETLQQSSEVLGKLELEGLHRYSLANNRGRPLPNCK